jgi:hypothetical protein
VHNGEEREIGRLPMFKLESKKEKGRKDDESEIGITRNCMIFVELWMLQRI